MFCCAFNLTRRNAMAKMIMIEDKNMVIFWECDKCLTKFKDKKNFEEKVSACPKCSEHIDEFVSLFDQES